MGFFLHLSPCGYLGVSSRRKTRFVVVSFPLCNVYCSYCSIVLISCQIRDHNQSHNIFTVFGYYQQISQEFFRDQTKRLPNCKISLWQNFVRIIYSIYSKSRDIIIRYHQCLLNQFLVRWFLKAARSINYYLYWRL